ncbi:MAG TPA: cohesin domain-containing protein [Candidatus Binatia bacterium]|jgi:hypothetical protein
MLKRTLLTAIAFASLVMLAPRPVQAVPIISAPFVTVGVGDTFTIPISITGATDLTSWQFDLGFNPIVVSALSFTDSGTDFEAAATSQGGVLTGITGFILSNQFSGLADSMSGLISGSGLQGNGSLAFLEFHALFPGVSPLTFSNVFLNLSDQGFERTNGQITVTGIPPPPPSVPEPTVLALLISGLALLGARRLAGRRRRDEF